MDIQGVAAHLTANLGTTLTAALAGVTDRYLPGRWANGTAKPSDVEATRITNGYTAFKRIANSDGPDVARAYFIGTGDDLDDDDTIITALREDRFSEVRAAVTTMIK